MDRVFHPVLAVLPVNRAGNFTITLRTRGGDTARTNICADFGRERVNISLKGRLPIAGGAAGTDARGWARALGRKHLAGGCRSWRCVSVATTRCLFPDNKTIQRCNGTAADLPNTYLLGRQFQCTGLSWEPRCPTNRSHLRDSYGIPQPSYHRLIWFTIRISQWVRNASLNGFGCAA